MSRTHSTDYPRKAIVMYSGGADSTLALQLMLDQGIECIALNVKTPFCSCTHGGCAGAVGDIIIDNDIPVRTRFLADEYMKMLRNPKYGYGRGMNPCSDCRIMMLRAARNVMIEEGASFVVTGEVVGQRPNSQMYRQMQHVEKDSGLSGRLLRPLSAKLLPPTWPETAGIVDRRSLCDFQGRTRTRQKELAEELNTGELPNSGGGCVLTEPRYADKVRDMYRHWPDGVPSIEEAQLLRVGRHFRIRPTYKIIVGRDEAENEAIERLYTRDDMLLVPDDETAGPTALVHGPAERKDWDHIAAIVLRYCRPLNGNRPGLEVFSADLDEDVVLKPEPLSPAAVREYLI